MQLEAARVDCTLFLSKFTCVTRFIGEQVCLMFGILQCDVCGQLYGLFRLHWFIPQVPVGIVACYRHFSLRRVTFSRSFLVLFNDGLSASA